MTAAHILQESADDLRHAAERLVKLATEINGVANMFCEASDSEGLKGQSLAIQSEAMRCAMVLLAVHSAGERLAVVSRLAASESEASHG